jgi:uncharacterized protein YkwD
MPRATLVLLALVACGGRAPLVSGASAARVEEPAPVAPHDSTFDFRASASSPRPLAELPDTLAPFFRSCGAADAALSKVAERFARRQSEGGAPVEVSELSFALRAEGSPYVWPRAWTLEGADLLAPASLERMRAWLAGFDDGGERRCGLALVSSNDRSVLSAVVVDALADLSPVPVRQRAGAWVDVRAALLVPATNAKVIVLGPHGAPYTVPTSFDGRNVRARLRADRPGAFLLQLLAHVAGGPRPVLEATVYADVPPPSSFNAPAAPGEPSTPLEAGDDLGAALLRMINRARATEQRSPLRREPALDALAQAHAEGMRRAQRVAHDVGDGDPRSRVEAAELDVLESGENVAHALDVTRAHRLLWASPSHRENLLEARFDGVGIGLARDDDGSLWVCEVFADLR